MSIFIMNCRKLRNIGVNHFTFQQYFTATIVSRKRIIRDCTNLNWLPLPAAALVK